MTRELGYLLVGLAVAGCTGEIGSTFTGGQGGGNTTTGFTTTSTGQGGIGAMGTGTDCSDCTEKENGVGTDNPFDTDNNPSDNVGLDDEGALVLDPSNSSIPGIIWIANTNQNTVTKVDTTTYQVLGRYNLGSSDPSRTSVNSSGDVFVGLRNGNTLTKVSAGGKDCPDTNNDNQITTSTGQNDVLAWGQDDCVLWSVPVPNSPKVRAVAAQDEVVPDPIPDDPDNVKINRYVWVGGTNHKTAYKFDGETGQLLIQTSSPSHNYGFALDAEGMLWISGATEGAVGGRIDTKKCFDQQSCDAAEVCTRDCSNGTCACTQCSVDCDQAIKERILLPTNVYGVTVDFKQRVWWGGNAMQRYNRFVPEAQRHTMASPGAFVHGIGADAKGMVWGAASNQIIRLDVGELHRVRIKRQRRDPRPLQHAQRLHHQPKRREQLGDVLHLFGYDRLAARAGDQQARHLPADLRRLRQGCHRLA